MDDILKAMEDEDPDLWIDWDSVVENWLDLIRPVWYEKLVRYRRQTRSLLLRDVGLTLMDSKPVDLLKMFGVFFTAADVAATR